MKKIIMLVMCLYSVNSFALQETKSTLIAEVENCKIYEIIIGSTWTGKTLYLSKCNDSIDSSLQYRIGKSDQYSLTENEILKKAESIKQRNELLNRLTPEERKLLNSNW